jgi:DnaJ-class molecular chaperone
VLSNEQTKQIYDKFGEKGLKDRKKGQGESDYKKAQALNIVMSD